MLTVAQLDALALDRLEDARVLLHDSRLDGAVYLTGYSVELALKARICRTLEWTEFPVTNREFEKFKSLRTHDLEVLLRFSGVEARVKAGHLPEWSLILDWDPERRYRPSGAWTAQKAGDIVAAAAILVGVL